MMTERCYAFKTSVKKSILIKNLLNKETKLTLNHVKPRTVTHKMK